MVYKSIEKDQYPAQHDPNILYNNKLEETGNIKKTLLQTGVDKSTTGIMDPSFEHLIKTGQHINTGDDDNIKANQIVYKNRQVTLALPKGDE